MTKAILVRDDGTIAPAGLKLIEKMAAEHKTQRFIAMTLGIPYKKFEKMLETKKGDNEVRMAWEAGFAKFDQHVTDIVRAAALGDVIETKSLDDNGEPIVGEDGEPIMVRIQAPVSKAQIIAMIYWTKAQMGWSEKPQGAMTQDNRIQIVIPAPLQPGALFAALGQTEIADFRKDKSQPLPTLRDVTPTGQLPPPVAKESTP